MNIEIRRESDIIIMLVEGEIDEVGAEAMKARFREMALMGGREVKVDFSKVNHIGSAGIGKLLVFYKELAIRQATLSLINVPLSIFELLQEVKLDSIFSITARK